MKQLIQLFSLLTLSGFITPANAADGPLLNQALTNMPENPEVLVLEIDIAPGAESPPHRHNAHVFVYVLEGTMNMQVAGGELVTLEAGEMFYEDPDSTHTVSQNASSTEPAKILVQFIKSIGAAVSVPAAQ